MVQPSVTGLKQKTYWDFVNVYDKTKLPYGLQAAQYQSLKCILQHYLVHDIEQGV